MIKLCYLGPADTHFHLLKPGEGGLGFTAEPVNQRSACRCDRPAIADHKPFFTPHELTRRRACSAVRTHKSVHDFPTATEIAVHLQVRLVIDERIVGEAKIVPEPENTRVSFNNRTKSRIQGQGIGLARSSCMH